MSAPGITAASSSSPNRARRWTAVAAAPLAALAVWSVVHLVAGVDLAVGNGAGQTAIGAVAVVTASLVAGLAGWALLAGLERFTTQARGIWTIIAATVLLISLLGPLGGIDASSKLGLATLHLVVGLVLIPMLRRAAR